MTLTLHTANKMVEDADALFIFGDDLEAILDALEEDEGVQEEFSAAVNNVSVGNWTFNSRMMELWSSSQPAFLPK